jgi:hypothetical protein
MAFLLYDRHFFDAVILGVLSTILLLILFASFRSKIEPATVDADTRQSLAIVADLDNLSLERKIIGTVIACCLLAAAAYLNIGLFAGILVFIAEVIVLYALKWMYGTGSTPSLSSAT